MKLPSKTDEAQVMLVVMNPPAKAGDIRDTDSIPGLGRSPGEEMATHFTILAWSIPWLEEPGGLQSIGMQRVRHDRMRCPSVLGKLWYLDLQSLGKNQKG